MSPCFRSSMLRLLVSLAALSPGAAAHGASAANDYSLDQNWLCRPGRADACSPTSATVIDADGARHRVQGQAAAAPPIDCFYVYPTVSKEAGMNSDLASTGVEEATATSQFAPFAAACRPFAPRYRQVTVAGLHAALQGGARPDTALAYGDVLDAWHRYLEHDNQGRGVVLIGHSQGSKILVKLIAAEIDGKPLQDRLVSAIVPGALVEVPLRPDAGGTFAHIPLCTRASDTGCVIAYSSFLAADQAVDQARFGVAEQPGRVAACVNPAQLLGVAFLAPEFPAKFSSSPDVDTTFIDLPELMRGECVTRGEQRFLAISWVDDLRTPRVARGLQALQARRPTWGLHVLDVNLALGNLVAIVTAQGRAWKPLPALAGH